MAEYIEREALAEFLKDEIQQCETALVESNGEDDRYEQAVESRMLGLVDAWRKVTNTAAADVEPVRHGEWIKKQNPMAGVGDLYLYYRCSICEEIAMWDDFGNIKKTRYCPNCGAKMDGKGEGE